MPKTWFILNKNYIFDKKKKLPTVEEGPRSGLCCPCLGSRVPWDTDRLLLGDLEVFGGHAFILSSGVMRREGEGWVSGLLHWECLRGLGLEPPPKVHLIFGGSTGGRPEEGLRAIS